MRLASLKAVTGVHRKSRCSQSSRWYSRRHVSPACPAALATTPLTLLWLVAVASVLIVSPRHAAGVGTVYDEAAAACGAPLQDALFDGDSFIWRDCSDVWHVRGRQAQPARARLIGRIGASNAITDIHGYATRSDGWLRTSPDDELLFDLVVEDTDSGFDFSVPTATALCADVRQTGSSGLLRVGEYGTPVSGAVDPDTLLPCQPGAAPAIFAPANTSVLGGSTQLFVLDKANQTITDWTLDVGSSAGANDYFDSASMNGASSLVVSGLPVDASLVHATLHYQLSGGSPQSLAYVYTAASGGAFSSTNMPPQITAPADQSNTEQHVVSLGVTATDPEGQPLTNWSASGLPSGLAIDSNGLITGTLSAPGSAGVHPVSVSVHDGNIANTSTVNFSWQIEPAGFPQYVPPSAPLPTAPYLWEVSAASSAGATIDLGHQIRTGYDYREMFGFNLNWFAFQAQVWNTTTASLSDASMASNFSTYLSGVRQRFPGGNNSVSWVWDQTQGPISTRSDWEAFYGGALTTPHFGIDEFLTYSQSINAKSFFHVLNLTGLYPPDIDQLATKEAVAANNAALASYLDQQWPSSYPQWQLGNELDRARIGFTHQQLEDRSQASIDAIRVVQPDARFIAHLREHDYQGDSWQGFMQDTYDDLPQVHDHALFAYYDPSQDPGFIPVNSILYWIPWYMFKLQENIDYFENTVRPGQTARIWMTEHARRRLSVDWNDPPLDSAGDPYDPTPWLVSNLGGSISTADYLIAIMQVPQVLGAMYHGSPGGPWRLFDNILYDGDFDPLTIFWTYALLNQNTLSDVVATVNESTNAAGYLGNYDTRAVAFHDGACEVRVWVVNRRMQALNFEIKIPLWAGDPVSIEHASIYGAAGQDPDETGYEGVVSLTPQSLGNATLSGAGATTVSLPPSSINVYTLACN